jgi:NodT family efflux transporter outer membrane factor (OMF) lipoprotein
VSPSPVRALALALAVSATLTAGCTVGPKYARPAPTAPPNGQFVSTTPAIAAADQPPPNWWKLYNTPALDDLVQEALVHNKNLLQAAANLRYARAALSLARAGRYPSTTLSAGAQEGVTADSLFASRLEGAGTPPATALYSVGLDASYEVDLFGRIRRTVQAAKADYEAQKATEDATRISVAGETTRAYVNACAYAQELSVARQSLDLVTQNYQVILKQAQFGAVDDFDVARARQLVSQTQASVPGFEGQRRTALFELAVLTGRTPEEVSKAADACKAPPTLSNVLPVGDAKALFQRRPDVRQAERQLAANVARIGVATANLYPTISIGGSVGSAAGGAGGLTSASNLSYGLGPLLNWTFPNTLVAQAQIRQARATASASYANFEGVVLTALKDVEEALTSYGAELDRNGSLVQARDQSQIAYKLARIQYDNGAISYLDVLTAETNLVNANAALADSDQALASDQVTVFKALGGGWEQAPAVEPLPITDRRTGKDVKIN